MNNRSQFFGVFVLMAMVGVYGCAEPGRPSPQDILTKPPYASLTDSIRQFPKNADLYTARGIRLSQHNLHELATADYQQAWQLSKTETAALLYVSNLLLTDDHTEAIKVLKESMAAHPENTDLRRRLSEIYAQTGNFAQALEQYDELVQRDSLNFEAWFEKGMLLSRLKDTAAAIDALRRSYRIQPVKYTGLSLATLYSATRDPQTIPFCDEMIQRDTTGILTEMFYIKGTYYSDTRQYAKAIEQFDSCINRDWKYADAHIEKGIVMFEQKKYREALAIFTTAISIANTNPDAYYWAARCYEAVNNKDMAIANYQRALALDKYLVEAEEGLRRLKG